MKRYIIHRCVRKIVNIYKRVESLIVEKEMAYFGDKSMIEHPFVVSNPQNIYIGDCSTILKNSRIQTYEYDGQPKPKIKIGNRCYFVHNVSILASSEITIGDDVLIASNVLICDHDHGMNPEDAEPYMEQKLYSEPICIGSNVWIGEQVVICKGCHIGDNSIIGAGSIVTTNVPENTIVVGSPARPIKKWSHEKREWVRV